MILDSILTILQGTNHPLGWIITSLIHSSELVAENKDLMDSYSGTSLGLSIASGLLGSVVVNGYFLASFGLLFVLPILGKITIRNIIASLSFFLIVLIALYYNQQRMAFYAFIFLSTIMIGYIIKVKGGTLNTCIITCIIVFICALLFNNFSNIELGRLAEVDSSVTNERNSNSIEYFSDFLWKDNNLFLGNSVAYRKLHNGSTPHNMFAETTLYGGIFGLLIYIVFLCKLFNSMFCQFKKRNCFIILPICCICGIMLVALTHSSGFHTGFTLGFYAYSFFVIFKRYNLVLDKTY